MTEGAVAPVREPGWERLELPYAVSQPTEPHISWLRDRKSGIGGSDASAVLGVSPWKSRWQLWSEKTSGDVDLVDNERMAWGRHLEDAIADEFVARTGLKVQRMRRILRHPDVSFMLANIDRRIVGERAGLECKNRGMYARSSYQANGPTDSEMAQCQHYMCVTGWSHWYLAVLVGGNEWMAWRIERDEGYIAQLTAAATEFWEQYVVARVPPPIDATVGAADFLADTFDEPVDDELICGEAQLPIFDGLADAAQQAAIWATTQRGYTNALKELMGNVERVRCGPYTASWKADRNGRRRFTWRKEEEHGDE